MVFQESLTHQHITQRRQTNDLVDSNQHSRSIGTHAMFAALEYVSFAGRVGIPQVMDVGVRQNQVVLVDRLKRPRVDIRRHHINDHLGIHQFRNLFLECRHGQ